MKARYAVQELTAHGWLVVSRFESPQSAFIFAETRRAACRVWDCVEDCERIYL